MRKAHAMVRDLSTGGPQTMVVGDRFAKFSRRSEMPVLQRGIDGGGPCREAVVQSLERQAVPADTFAIPRISPRRTRRVGAERERL